MLQAPFACGSVPRWLDRRRLPSRHRRFPATNVVAGRVDAERLTLDPAYPDEDWGLLADRQPPRVHDLEELAALAGQSVDPRLLELQVFAVEARYEEGPSPLPAARQVLLALVEAELDRCALRVKELSDLAGGEQN